MTMIGSRPSEPLQIELRHRGPTVVVVVSGEIDIACTYDLETSLRAAWTRSGHVVLDLREVEFLDCSGLRAILDFHHMSRESGGDFALIPGPRQVQRLFEVTRLAGALRFVDPDAIAAD